MKCRRSVIIHSVMPKVISLLICVHSETDYNFSFYWTSLYYKHQLLFVPFPTIHESTLKWVLSKFEIFSIVLLLPNLRNSMTSCVHFALCCFCRFSPYLHLSLTEHFVSLFSSSYSGRLFLTVLRCFLIVSEYFLLSFSPSFVAIRSCTFVLSHFSRYTFIVWAAGWGTDKKVTGTLQGEAYKRNELCSFQLPVDRNYWSYASRQTQAHR